MDQKILESYDCGHSDIRSIANTCHYQSLEKSLEKWYTTCEEMCNTLKCHPSIYTE
jgi:hypothetical protein